MTWDPTDGGRFSPFGGELTPEVAERFSEAEAAGAELVGEGAIDDLHLLSSLLHDADDDVLTVLGPHYRKLLSAVDAAVAAHSGPRPLPRAEDVLEVATTEAIGVSGSADSIGALHMILALFSFPGCAAEEVLEDCGIDWRPLRSIARRLVGRPWSW